MANGIFDWLAGPDSLLGGAWDWLAGPDSLLGGWWDQLSGEEGGAGGFGGAQWPGAYQYTPGPEYTPFGGDYPIPDLPLYGGQGQFPGLNMPSYQPFGQQYPEYQQFGTAAPQPGAYYDWETYQGFGEQFPEYQAYTSPLMKQLSGTISSRMRGEGVGTEGAEQAIWERATERADVSARKAQQQMLEHFAGRGIPYSGPHLEQYGELGAEYQRQLGEVSRELAIQQSQQRQSAIESAMGRAQQMGQFGAAESAREQLSQEKQYAAGLGEHRAEYLSESELAKERARETLTSERMTWQQQAQQNQLAQEARMKGFEFEAGEHRLGQQMQQQNAQIEYQAQVQAYQAMEQRAQYEYESLIQQGLTRAQAQQEAYRMGQVEYQKEYESRLTEAERRGQYDRNIWQGDIQRWLAEFGAQQGQATSGDWIWNIISNLLGGWLG